jgi:hypothetical protein
MDIQSDAYFHASGGNHALQILQYSQLVCNNLLFPSRFCIFGGQALCVPCMGLHCEGLSVCAAIMRVHFVGSPVDASLVVKSAEFRATSTGRAVTSNVQSVECPTRTNLQLNKTEVSP